MSALLIPSQITAELAMAWRPAQPYYEAAAESDRIEVHLVVIKDRERSESSE